MKKTWEINASTIEASLDTAIKQIQKFTEKRKLAPVKLLHYEERSSEVAVTLLLEDANDTNVVDIRDWINNEKVKYG